MHSAILLLVLSAIVFVGSLAAFDILKSRKKFGDEKSWSRGITACVGAIAVIAFFVVALVYSIVYYKDLSDVAEMESFYESNLGAYVYTVERTGDIELTSSEPGILDVAYLNIGKVTGARLRELRDKVTWYNNRLQKSIRYNASWFLDGFLPDAPEYLKPIVLTGVVDEHLP